MVVHESDLMRQQDPVGIFELKIGDPVTAKVRFGYICRYRDDAISFYFYLLISFYISAHLFLTYFKTIFLGSLKYIRMTKHCSWSSIMLSCTRSSPISSACNSRSTRSVDKKSPMPVYIDGKVRWRQEWEVKPGTGSSQLKVL